MTTETVNYAMNDPITIASRRVYTLTFRSPLGKDIMELGNPFDIFGGGINQAALGRMIGRTASIEQLFVERLSWSDWHGCTLALLKFFDPPVAADPLATPVA